MKTTQSSNWTLGTNLFGTYSTCFLELEIKSRDLAGLAHWALEQFDLTKLTLYKLAAEDFVNGMTTYSFDSDPDNEGYYHATMEAVIEHKWKGGEAYDLSAAASTVCDSWLDFAPKNYQFVRFHNECDVQ